MGDTLHQPVVFQYYFFLTAMPLVRICWSASWCSGVLLYQLSERAAALPTDQWRPRHTYWHSVDFFWVLIFALLYVVR